MFRPGQMAQGQVLKPRDVLLNIDGFDLDIQGDYQDPDFGSLTLEKPFDPPQMGR